MNFLNILLANVIFNNFIINRLLNNNPDIGLVALYEIQKDFETIGFPIAITINSWLITIAVSLASSLFIYYFVFLKLNTTKPESILSALMSIFLIYSGVLFYLLYFLRVFNLSRGLLLLFTLIYSLIFLLLLIILKSNVLFKTHAAVKVRVFISSHIQALSIDDTFGVKITIAIHVLFAAFVTPNRPQRSAAKIHKVPIVVDHVTRIQNLDDVFLIDKRLIWSRTVERFLRSFLRLLCLRFS